MVKNSKRMVNKKKAGKKEETLKNGGTKNGLVKFPGLELVGIYPRDLAQRTLLINNRVYTSHKVNGKVPEWLVLRRPTKCFLTLTRRKIFFWEPA